MDREKVISAIENCIGQPKCRDCPWDDCEFEHEVVNSVPYGLLRDALTLLKEQEAAYQGAEELLRQKTMLFDDAIKRLKEQDAEILQLRLALDIAKGTCKGIRAEGR